MTRLGGVNARDIRMALRGKVDPELGKVLVGLAERQDHLFQLLQQTATHMDTLADVVLAQTSAVTALRSAHEQVLAAKRGGVKVQSEAADDSV